jgi:hypothetical protein
MIKRRDFMNQSKRPELVWGLTITTLGILVYIISSLINPSAEILSVIMFWFCIVALIVNISAFYTVNLTAKEFKKKMYWPWISFGLVLIYVLFLIILMLYTYKNNGMDPNPLQIALCVVLALSLILYLLGILKRVIDDKITYEEHINQSKNEK